MAGHRSALIFLREFDAPVAHRRRHSFRRANTMKVEIDRRARRNALVALAAVTLIVAVAGAARAGYRNDSDVRVSPGVFMSGELSSAHNSPDTTQYIYCEVYKYSSG